MKKTAFIALLCIIFKITGQAQQNQPPLVLGGIPISAGTYVKTSPYAITSTEEVTNTANVTYMAGNKIQLLPGFQVSELTNAGKFLGKIQPSDYEIVSMNSTWAFPKYSKMELGIKLPTSIQDQINTFFTSNGTTGLNPYDPDKLRIKFFLTINGTTYQRNAFYFRDFNVSNNYWVETTTAYPHRVRFAPPQTGNGTYSFEVWINGILQSPGTYGNTGTFTVTPSSSHGHLTTANNLNTRKFFFEDGTPFFGVGQNLWSGGVEAEECINGYCSCPETYTNLRSWMTSLADNGGNFTRLRIDHNQFPVMWPNQQSQLNDPAPDPNDLSKYLSSYDNNQKFMSELDKTFDLMEARDVHAILCLLEDQDYSINSAYATPQDLSPWASNPFSTILGPDHASCKSFFSGDPNNPATPIFKKYLDYIVARWGYSTSLAGWEMMNETYNICDIATGFHYDETKDPDHKTPIMDGMYQPYVYDTGLRTNVNAWICNMKSYLGQQYPWHPTTTGVTEIWGTPIQSNRLSCLDFWTTNEYSNFSTPTPNGNMYYLRDWNRFKTVVSYFVQNKPFVFGELGMPDNTNHIDSYNDRTFHNTNWITAVSGSLGTGLYWNDMDQAGAVDHRANFKTLKAFSDAIDWTKIWIPMLPNESGTSVGGKIMYTFNSVTGDGRCAIAYAMNNTSNWTIDDSLSYLHPHPWDLSYSGLLQAQAVDAANVEHYDINPSYSGSGSNPPVVIQGMWSPPSTMTPYTVDKYKTYGNGGLISSSTQYAYGNSYNLVFYEDMPAYAGPTGYPDYAYIVKPFGSFRTSDTLAFTSKDTVNLDPYFIPVKDDYSFTYDWGNGTTSNDSIAHVHYSNPGTYTVTLTVHNNKADTTASYTQIVKVTDAAAEMNNASISLYPNPATNHCFIKYDANTFNAPTIEVYDQLGKMVLNMPLNQTSEINIGSLTSGMYYVKFFGKGYQKVCKLIKQ